jgi:hypothetical protein
MTQITDFFGQALREGDKIAMLNYRGRVASLHIRYILRLEGGVAFVHTTPVEPEDKREIGRLTNFDKVIRAPGQGE